MLGNALPLVVFGSNYTSYHFVAQFLFAGVSVGSLRQQPAGLLLLLVLQFDGSRCQHDVASTWRFRRRMDSYHVLFDALWHFVLFVA